jgi:RNA polymerase sigma-70 factor (ECF subfamily)
MRAGIRRALRLHTRDGNRAVSGLDFEGLVHAYYRPLYQFALSLTRVEAEASDLTQQTFYIWAAKGHQLRDGSKVKTWLFTTLHREFVKTCRKQRRFPHYELAEVDDELPCLLPIAVERLDATNVLQALARLPEAFQAPLALFYLAEQSYKEIAEILELPIGTVQSRIARGKTQLHRIVTTGESSALETKQRGRG